MSILGVMDWEPLVDVRDIPMTELIQLPVPSCLARIIRELDVPAYCGGFSSVITVRPAPAEAVCPSRPGPPPECPGSARQP